MAIQALSTKQFVLSNKIHFDPSTNQNHQTFMSLKIFRNHKHSADELPSPKSSFTLGGRKKDKIAHKPKENKDCGNLKNVFKILLNITKKWYAQKISKQLEPNIEVEIRYFVEYYAFMKN